MSLITFLGVGVTRADSLPVFVSPELIECEPVRHCAAMAHPPMTASTTVVVAIIAILLLFIGHTP
jgi:hypothetical protein